MEILYLEKENIIKDVRIICRLKKELNYIAIKDIRNLFRLEKETKVINTLTANYEYSRNNTDDLPLPVQMQLSEKLKTFSPQRRVYLNA